MTLTCSTCPLARPIEGNRYECTSAHKSVVVRGHWQGTADCDHAVAQHELEQHIDEQASEIAPEPVLPETRLEVCVTPDPEKYAVYSYKPKYIQPGKYTVVYFGGNSWGCTCPSHQHRGGECKHIKAVKAEENPQRESIRLDKASGWLTPTYYAYLGNAQLGIAKDMAEAEALADRFFNQERSRHLLRKRLLVTYAA